jgi:FkbH-like protein
MYQLEWPDIKAWKKEKPVPSGISMVDRKNIHSVLGLRWEDHCVECGFPECYSSCVLFQKKADGHCSRLAYGMIRNDLFSGLYNFGVDLKFLKWGKIEANLRGAYAMPLWRHSVHETLCRNPYYQRFSRKMSGLLYGKDHRSFDSFVLECFSPNRDEFKLMLEYFVIEQDRRKAKFRSLFLIRPGHNYYELPFDKFGMSSFDGYVYLYPENNIPEKRLIFTWLDFVRYRKQHKQRTNERTNCGAGKIKCVAWDLDNTLWKGILSESDTVVLRNESISLIKELDSRGILQTIVSKNDHQEAVDKLKQLDIEQYFLHPAINWSPKSDNLKAISGMLNLGLDAFAFIDDSPFEREEVRNAFPEVRVYSETEIGNLARYDEFDVAISSESGNRRLSYLVENERRSSKEKFSGDYLDFLASCEMAINMFVPGTKTEVKRCWELIQRSNQLNLSGKRFTEREFDVLLANPDFLNIGIRCKDKFGDYGIVGFASISLKDRNLILGDFVLSCRVAQKKVEHFFFKSLVDFFFNNGYSFLTARFIATAKNSILGNVFADLNFEEVSSTGNLKMYRLTFNKMADLPAIMKFEMEESVHQFFKRAFF